MNEESPQPAEIALGVSVEQTGGSVLVSLDGELDLGSAGKLERELAKAEAAKPDLVAVDVRRLSFMDSSGLRLLLLGAERAREQGRRFVVIQGSPEVDRVLEITGADEQLELVDEAPEPFRA